jgi:hypothetical protein
MQKAYEAPEVHSEKVEIGVYGNYSGTDTRVWGDSPSIFIGCCPIEW